MSPFFIYLTLQVDNIRDVAGFGLVLWAILLFFIGIFTLVAEETAMIKAIIKYTKWPVVLALAVMMLMPETRTIVAMTTIPTVLENEHVKALPEEVLSLIRGIVAEETQKLTDKD